MGVHLAICGPPPKYWVWKYWPYFRCGSRFSVQNFFEYDMPLMPASQKPVVTLARHLDPALVVDPADLGVERGHHLQVGIRVELAHQLRLVGQGLADDLRALLRRAAVGQARLLVRAVGPAAQVDLPDDLRRELRPALDVVAPELAERLRVQPVGEVLRLAGRIVAAPSNRPRSPCRRRRLPSGAA